MEKEEYFKSEDDIIYKTVEYADGSMAPFLFQWGTNKWVSCTIGHLAQAQWNGWKIDKVEAEQIMERQKKETK